jgi:hypothetical protein
MDLLRARPHTCTQPEASIWNTYSLRRDTVDRDAGGAAGWIVERQDILGRSTRVDL